MTQYSSLLPGLEGIAAAALALNLAYLNLENFRYRKRIRDAAVKHLSELRRDANIEAHENTRYFRELAHLASLPNNDDTETKEADGQFKNSNNPQTAWAKTYNFFYSKHQDRWSCGIAAAFSLAALALGSAHSVGFTVLIDFFNVGYVIAGTFWILLASVLLPGGFMLLASKFVVRRGLAHIIENKKELELHMKGQVRSAAYPNDAPQPEQQKN